MKKVLVKRGTGNTPSSSAFSTLQLRQIPTSHIGKNPHESHTNLILYTRYNDDKRRLH